MDDHFDRLCLLFAELLEYPTPALEQQATECIGLLTTCPEAGDALAKFQAWMGQEGQSRREEIYTNTFDLQSVCYPYVGHYLFGVSYKRSWFMARLNQGYREKCFSPISDLPDHMAVILRFLAKGIDDDFSQVLLIEGVIPAVKKMLRTFEDKSTNPYRWVLKALYLELQDFVDLAIPVASGKGGLVDA